MPTWNGSTDGSFINDANWDTVAAVDGDTITVTLNYIVMANPLPTSDQPTSGTYDFYFGGVAINQNDVWAITDYSGLPGFFLDDGAAVGDVVVDNYDANVLCGIACNSVSILDGLFYCTASFAIVGGVTVGLDGVFGAGNTNTDVLFTDDGYMHWNNGIVGSFNADGNTVRHTVVGGVSSMNYTNASNFDLGGDVPDLAVEINAATIMIDDITCGDLTLTSSILDLGDNLLTVSNLARTGGTLTTTTDYGGTIDTGPIIIRNVRAEKWIDIIGGRDGNGNRKLVFHPHSMNRNSALQNGIILDPRPVVVPRAPDYTIGLNFATQVGGSYPPDTQGAVGPDHIVQAINGDFSVYSKTDGSILVNTSLYGFFNDAGSGSEHSPFDPRIVYDPNSERFFVIAADGRSNTPGSNCLIAVSSSSDATEAWNSFRFDTQGIDPNSKWLDYPILGYNSEVVSVVAYMISKDAAPPGPAIYRYVYVFPKDDLLLETPNIDNAYRSTEEEQLEFGSKDTPVFDPYGSMPHLIVGVNNSFPDYFRVAEINEGSAYNIAETNRQYFVDEPNIGGAYGRQPDGVQSLHHHTIHYQPQSPVKVGDYIYGSYNTIMEGDNAIAFYRMHAPTQTVLSVTTIHYPDMDMIYASVAVNNNGRIVIGFTGTGPNIYPNSYCVVGRLANDQYPPYAKAGAVFSDPIQLSFSTQTHLLTDQHNRNRWGDYSSTVVDPVNNDHFWTFQEYPLQGSERYYRCRATQIKLG